jgi:predicted DCC family thiol-disulfide oxidoreductase YuxK
MYIHLSFYLVMSDIEMYSLMSVTGSAVTLALRLLHLQHAQPYLQKQAVQAMHAMLTNATRLTIATNAVLVLSVRRRQYQNFLDVLSTLFHLSDLHT